MIARPAESQILQGDWVDASEAAIDKHRKTDVTVIVLDDRDRAVHNATVRLEQKRHDFAIGLTLPADRLPPDGFKERAVYRCFNAIALDRLTDWSTPPAQSEHEPREVIASWRRAIDPIRTDFGRVVSADPARNTDKLSLLKPTDLRDAILARIDLAMGYQPEADRFDLYADLLYQDLIERKLGRGMLHRMFERAHARRPEALCALRVRDAISLQHGRELGIAAQKLEIQQVPFDRITIEQRFTGQVQPRALARMLEDYVANLPVPATLVGLEVGGPSEIAAGLNMETVLRLAFAQPAIEGIFFSGLRQDETYEQHAALIDDEGRPTALGVAMDKLFNSHWRTDVSLPTDERGNASARVFTGWYTVTATLPGGQVITSEAYFPKAQRTKLLVLQQTAAE